jgi:tetratricopeptide (TPR) repeat protein
MWLRLFPGLISFSGSLGLATAGLYLFLVTVAMVFDHQEIILWLVGDLPHDASFGWATVLIPFALLSFYLVERAHLGMWYLRKGKVDLARSYSESRITVIPAIRSRSEAVEHRLVAVLCLCRENAYAEALKLLQGYEPNSTGSGGGPRLPQPLDTKGAARYRLLNAEILLRQENLIKAHQLLEEPIEGPNKFREALIACRAELAIRESNIDRFREELGKAEWIRRSIDHGPHIDAQGKPIRTQIGKYVRATPRLAYTKAVAATRFDFTRAHLLWATAVLSELETTPFYKEFPGRKAEILFHRALLLEKSDLVEEAQSCARKAWITTSDRRSQALLKSAKSQLVLAEKPLAEEHVKET